MSSTVYLILRASVGICMPAGILKSVRSLHYKKGLTWIQAACHQVDSRLSHNSLYIYLQHFQKGKITSLMGCVRTMTIFDPVWDSQLFSLGGGVYLCLPHVTPESWPEGADLVWLCHSRSRSLTGHSTITINNLRKPGSWMENKIKDGYRVPHELLAVSLM